MSEKLRNCPFCGGEKIELEYCEEECCGALPILYRCSCGAELWVNVKTDEEAIKAWNTRADGLTEQDVEGVMEEIYKLEWVELTYRLKAKIKEILMKLVEG